MTNSCSIGGPLTKTSDALVSLPLATSTARKSKPRRAEEYNDFFFFYKEPEIQRQKFAVFLLSGWQCSQVSWKDIKDAENLARIYSF